MIDELMRIDNEMNQLKELSVKNVDTERAHRRADILLIELIRLFAERIDSGYKDIPERICGNFESMKKWYA